ncbi:MAG: hypothetical protein JXR84_19165 [Anaerolineae bacterium]|nr:hypothetical protein [Anaerolineae bacterium]
MDKGVGFNRQLQRSWLDTTAAFVAEVQDPLVLRERLEAVLQQDMAGVEARRKTIDLLLNLWLRTQEDYPELWTFAVAWNRDTPAPQERLWLHYGLALVCYSFFRDCVAVIGQLGRYEEPVTNRVLIRRLAAERGQLGSLERATQHVTASLRDWGLLADALPRYTYKPCLHIFTASHSDLETWLLACALQAHPAEALPFADLVRLPELFPFQVTVTVDGLRTHPWFTVRREGAGWDMVGLARG